MHVGMNRDLLMTERDIGGVPHARGDEPVCQVARPVP